MVQKMTRREVREQIFKVLFDVEFHEEAEIDQQIELYFERLPEDDSCGYPSSIPEEEKKYIGEKTASVAKLIPEIDEKINEVAKGWKTQRMGKADLSILRLAVYEMKYDEEIPVNVAINEAVELAKKFGSDNSPAFVNGILAKLV